MGVFMKSFRNKPHTKEKFIKKSFKGNRYLAARILRTISPTLFGLKPATSMSFFNLKEINLIELWDACKRDMELASNIEIFELKRESNVLVILFYDKLKLAQTLYDQKNMRFLSRFGYSERMGIEEMLEHLKSRYTQLCPHEIGIFMGIPLKDVLGYMGLISAPCSHCGYWKVYGNPEDAKKLFMKYRKVEEKVAYLIASGEDPLDIISQPQICYELVCEDKIQKEQVG